jgi:hypothetical protein
MPGEFRANDRALFRCGEVDALMIHMAGEKQGQ